MRQPSSTHLSRRHLFLAGTAGLLCAVLTLLRISLPTAPLFSQFAQFSPVDRAILLIKLLSPLFLFFLAGG
ncbi:hypothetical protein [Ktedonospora formicarum]|uniref:hypothetical protein n=1 Tax=Ktedonospora formicarum TaxID=2778364 RepID=UPI001C6879AC|nr:hypothetical protein [Ktedonospora formicarum]